MSDNPFVKVGTAGSLKLKDNNTGGTPLLEADQVHGHLEISGNIAGAPQNEGAVTGKAVLSGFVKWVLGIVSGVAIIVICAWLGYK